MRKLLLLMFALLTGVSGAWAIDVVVSDQTNLNTITNSNFSTTAAHKYGTYSAPAGGTTFTTNSTSGLSGVTITSTSNIVKPFYYSGGNYKYGLAFKPSDGDTYTITISAPENYVIVGYTMKAISTTSNQQFEVVASSGTYTVSSSQNYITGRVGNEKSTTFTLKNKKNNASTYDAELCLPFFTITVLPADASSLKALKATNVSDISKSKTYLVHSIDYSASDKSRGYLSATSGYLACTSKTGNWAPSSFAFVQYDGKYFLYDVANKNFVRTENYSSNSNEVKGIETNTSILPVTLEKISDGTFKIKMGVNCMNFSGSYTYGITINYYTDNDAGNNLEIIENGSFDDTEAIATLKAYLANPTIVNGGKYKIKLNGTNYYVSKDASGNAKTEETASELIISENGTNAAGKKAYSIKDAGTNKYLSYTNITYSGGQNSRLSWADTDANSKFVFTQGSGTYSSNVLFRPADACDNNYVTSWNQTKTDQVFVFWTISDPMSYWTLEKVTKTVTYNLNWNGSTIKTNSSVSAHIGGAAADYIPWDVPAFCSFSACNPETVTAETSEVNLTMTSTLPFTISSSYADATWYYMTIRDKYYVIYNPNSENKTSTSSTTAKADAVAAAEKALWAFTGDPINGFKVMNKAAGDGMYLNSNATPLRMAAADALSLWTIGQNNTGFTFNNGGYYINDVSRTLGWWNDDRASTDEGSTLRIEAVDYYDLALAYIDQYASDNAVGDDEYFGVRTASKSTYKSQIETAFSANHAGLTKSVYENTIKPGCSAMIVYPESGYYRIKSSGNRKGETYITYGYCNEKSKYGLVTTPAANKMKDAGTIFKLTSTGTQGVYTLSTQGLNVQDETGSDTPFTATDAEGATFTFEFVSKGFAAISHTPSGTHTYFHESSWDSPAAVVRWEKPSVQSHWSIEKATSLDIELHDGGDGNYYATLCLPFDVTLDGCNAYTMTLSGDYLVPSEAITTVPAGTPVLLRGTSATATAQIVANAATSAPLTSALTGSYVPTPASEGLVDGKNVYTLAKVDNEVGFYRYTGTSIRANAAYLLLDKNLQVRGFRFDFGGTDAITHVVTPTKPDAPLYDLQGRRVGNATHGIYIQNGKKILK